MKFLYRGIDKRDPKKAQWVTGSYHQHLPYTPYPIGGDPNKIKEDTQHLIISDGFSDWGLPRSVQAIEVYPESVGISTGFVLNNHMIYEGDILYILNTELAIDDEFFVYWDKDEYAFKLTTTFEKNVPVINTYLSTINDMKNIELLKLAGNVWERNLEKS